MKLLKFGGSSVETPERIRKVADIILKSQKENKEIAVVFSAFGGVTDKLIETSALAAKGDEKYKKLFSELEKRHLDAVNSLIDVEKQTKVLNHIKNLLKELEALLLGVYLVKELSPKTLDAAVSLGEILSAYIISEYLKEKTNAEFLDARDLIKTDNCFGSAKVDFVQTNKKIKEYFNQKNNDSSNNKTKNNNHANSIQCITGFVASTANDQTTTLGRGGSDYTAAIFAAALGAEELEVWKDVEGVLTADPKKVKKAFSLKTLTYDEAMELSHFGAKVIHPYTMRPVLERKIPIRIRNTFEPEFLGTLITDKYLASDYLIKGVSSINEVTLLTLQGKGMIGVAGIASRLFGALAEKSINIILITQASSEQSICFAIEPKHSNAAKKAVEDEFALELKAGVIDEVKVEKELSIIAIVGENMKRYPGISGRLFQALGKNGINAIAIAQGSSELNISVVINKHNEAKALNVVHDAFFLSGTKTLNVFLVGTGLVGGTLLKQIHAQAEYLKNENLIEVKIIAIANHEKMLFSKETEGIVLDDWKGQHAKSSAASIKEFVAKMKALNLSNSVFVDCTASDEIVSYYNEILDASISIVTPNKRANSGSYEDYIMLKNTAKKRNVRFIYETNVGAGLPVINSLQDLMYSGDKILKIEAVLSGTLSYIFNNFKQEKKFSEIVKKAKELGYTEPDPRDDLNGMDFARKLLILAREAGFMLELKDVAVENILPESCVAAKNVDEFFIELENNESFFEQKKKNAEAKGKTLRFIGILETGNNKDGNMTGKARISLVEVDNTHPFYSLSGADNIISFTTQRYLERPLVIRGPGAGAEITAAGVFADVINTANYLV